MSVTQNWLDGKLRQPLDEALATLRNNGWKVAVHNDYVLNGQAMTFWLFTHSATNRFIKGEGATDAEALERCAEALARLP